MSVFVCPMCDEFFCTTCFHEDPNEIDEEDFCEAEEERQIEEMASCHCGAYQPRNGTFIQVADCCC